MDGNHLQGSIPPSLSALKGFHELTLSDNNLSGPIPTFLEQFRALYRLNLSFNNFEGEVPKRGVFTNVSGISVAGNSQLCGGVPILDLPPCPVAASKKHKSSRLAIIFSAVGGFVCFVLLFLTLTFRCKKRNSRRKASIEDPMKEKHAKISYSELVKATDSFSASNLIGVGSFGSVYRGVFRDDSDERKVVAIKVLNLQQKGASKSFIAECEALRSIRHRNLVKIITSCSSEDFKGNDFKALVFEFMPNGSLENWLHPEVNEQSVVQNLSLMQRLNIAMDVASALDYLHHRGETPIVHCDLKPSNVLLDDDMTAHVGDFGLARFLMRTVSKPSQNSTSSICLKGSIGYVAPEYGVGSKVSTQGDMYSYGILLLEMFTAKRPTDDMFKEGLSLRRYVEMAVPEKLIDILDARLLSDQGDEEADTETQNRDDVIASMLRIGILCSKESPAERMQMGDVLRELHAIRDEFLRARIQGERNNTQLRGEGPSRVTQY